MCRRDSGISATLKGDAAAPQESINTTRAGKYPNISNILKEREPAAGSASERCCAARGQALDKAGFSYAVKMMEEREGGKDA